MKTVIIDYNSGNLHSAEKSFQRMAKDIPNTTVAITSDPETVARADRIVLPGVGAFADCRKNLADYTGLFEAIEERVTSGGVPFLGICVGMQMLATTGNEHGIVTDGFDWIKGQVIELQPKKSDLKVPHMGWNDLIISESHPIFEGIKTGDHAYFVHSYHLKPQSTDNLLATVDYGENVTAAVANGNIIGTQFHPEKSQRTGLQLISNFLKWKP